MPFGQKSKIPMPFTRDSNVGHKVLKKERIEKICHANTNQKEISVAMLISGNRDIRGRNMSRD